MTLVPHVNWKLADRRADPGDQACHRVQVGRWLHLADSADRARARPLARLAALETRKAFAYCGIWDESETYHEGDFVTCQGSLWHFDVHTTRARPGTSNHWQLSVKRGRAA